jgi:hypothetical protein
LFYSIDCFVFAKTRLMNQENLRPRFDSTLISTPYKGIMDCFVQVRFFGFSSMNIDRFIELYFI